MKQIAILKYTFMFDPSETWSNGYQFENRLADFFSYYGFQAQIIEAKGGTGERVVYIDRANKPATPTKASQAQESRPAAAQIKKVQQQQAPKTFKEFQSRGVPKSFTNQEKRAPQLSYSVGRANRMKVRHP